VASKATASAGLQATRGAWLVKKLRVESAGVPPPCVPPRVVRLLKMSVLNWNSPPACHSGIGKTTVAQVCSSAPLPST
jgi:hypothetical protein